MIASVTGRIAALGSDSVVVEVGGVGLSVQVTPPTRVSLMVGSSVTLHTALVVREESLTLFGFLDADERTLFELLQTASGVGPRLAQAMLSVHSPDALRRAVIDEDLRSLEAVPGIGRKGAQRIVLELKEKIGMPTSVSGSSPMGVNAPWRDQVHAALVGLGFSGREASEALELAVHERAAEIADGDSVDVAAILRTALRSRDRG